VLINMRSGTQPTGPDPILIAQPEPFFQRDFEDVQVQFVANVARNDRILIRLSPEEIRVPLDVLDVQH
jgi:hypothetical protein